MPPAAAGQDFIASLGELFQEVRAHDDAAGTNSFPPVAKQLVDLLTAARADYTVTLPDGSEPETAIQQPPAGFKPDAPLALQLSTATDPVEFLAVLDQALKEHMEEPDCRSRKRSNDSAAGATPRKRIILGGAGPTPGFVDKLATPVSQTAAPLGPEGAAGRLPSPPATHPNAVVRMDIRRDDRAVMSPSAFIRRATRGGIPRTEKDLMGSEDDVCEIISAGPSPAAVIQVLSDEDDSEINDEDDDDDDDDIVDLDSDLEMQEGTDDGLRADLSIRALHGTSTPPRDGISSKPEAQPAETLRHIIDDVRNTTPEQWEAYRPKLIESLLPYAEMEHARLSALSPAAAARLDAAVARLGDEMRVISPGDWTRYGAELRRLCGSSSFLACGFQQRLWKVMDVMYVEEETGAMESGDWDRLETVAKIVATVCEAMGPAGEGAGEVSRRWLCSKVQDIRFLKRIVTSINRKTRVLGVRGEE